MALKSRTNNLIIIKVFRRTIECCEENKTQAKKNNKPKEFLHLSLIETTTITYILFTICCSKIPKAGVVIKEAKGNAKHFCMFANGIWKSQSICACVADERSGVLRKICELVNYKS